MSKKPKVLDSFETAEGICCVDIFLRKDGTYGFAEYRNDPEDGGRRFISRDFSGQVFETRDEALVAARKSIQWLFEGTDTESGEYCGD